ncbi:MAG: valine--tRNA ligase [Parcubacteria group bacterium CG23_combo_of_CG06-09_8_20_14_all_35_9]|nr:MAG: valine--tRNA ligase [Parcubacteria group bacterium CG23_combo_of_CG06-09_8_20_14_all_35_9]
MDIPKTYNPQEVEDKIYEQWERSGYFNPDNLSIPKNSRSFSISMPPPNATGTLHIGHSVMLAIQDTVIRFERLRGKKALWLPGTDHAAIATQTKVEKILQKEGLTRHDLGREKFLKKVKKYVEESRKVIRGQIRKMGSSCDWSRERYTLDKELTRAVQEVFLKMYKDNLIYRGYRIVNWCPRCSSTLADDEVEYVTRLGKLYYLKYGPFIVATTRPETKIGDTAVAVHPQDKRYQKYIGKILKVNLGKVDIEVKVIADKIIDPEFGSGVVGVTPAHSQVDFDLAQKYNLKVKQTIGQDGKMMKTAGPYTGLLVEECRQKFIKDLEEFGLIEKIENYENNLSVCYRCHTPIEPLTSEQWFVNVNKKIPKYKASLKELAIKAVKSGKIKIIPNRFNKTYFGWLENLRDWCISRQIWFGHRIPVYYCKNKGCGKIIVSQKAPKKCPKCGSTNLKQDPDTLDTWFSSGLWTFSTLGWPQKTKDLKTYHPTSLMETGYDILFFWVARMIIMSTYALGEVPFKKVYLHGLIRDEKGKKMSKSLGNVIDPLDVIKKFGTDAVRLSLIIGTSPGADFLPYEEKIAGFRNFVNKLWNVSRFILSSVKKVRRVDKKPTPLTLSDKWILEELDNLIQKTSKELEKYNFSQAGEELYDFTWHRLADWYLEIAKIEGKKDKILLYILEKLLILWHPFTPFVTEKIWSHLTNSTKKEDLLMIQKWPEVKLKKVDKKIIEDFNLIQKIVTSIRGLRAENKIAPQKKISAILYGGAKTKVIKKEKEIIKNLARLKEIKIEIKGKKEPQSLETFVNKIKIYLPLKGTLDVDKERGRVNREIELIKRCISQIEERLTNKDFLGKAPQNIIEKEKEKLNEAKERLKKLENYLN